MPPIIGRNINRRGFKVSDTLLHDVILTACATNGDDPLSIHYYGNFITVGQWLRATGLNVRQITEPEAAQLSTKHKYSKDTIFKAFDLYDKEARTLFAGQSLEVWNNGKLVSRCQYEEIENANGKS